MCICISSKVGVQRREQDLSLRVYIHLSFRIKNGAAITAHQNVNLGLVNTGKALTGDAGLLDRIKMVGSFLDK